MGRPIDRVREFAVAVAAADAVLYERLAVSDRSVLDRGAPLVSRAADHSMVWFATATTMRLAGGRRARHAATRGVVSIAIASAVTNQLLKRVRWRDRPNIAILPPRRVARRMPTSSSFPSGHSASAAAFATAVAIEHRPLGAAVGIAAAAVAASRVVTGAHHPSDVVVGIGVGAAIALLGARLVPPAGPALADEAAVTPVQVPALPGGEGLVVIGNGGSGVDGENTALEAVADALPRARIVPISDGSELEAAAERAVRDGARALGACGGDGTILTIATVAVRHGLPLAVFAGGTFNHFAKDAGIPEIDAAAVAVGEGRGSLVDVATMNDDVFLNTASLGAYPEFVTERERLQPRYGKRLAAVISAWRLVSTADAVSIRVDGRPMRSLAFFAGNGRYAPVGFAPAVRPSLTSGMLDVRILQADHRAERWRLVWALLTGTLHRSGLYEEIVADSVDIDVDDHGGVLVSRDGEVGEPANHLEFRVLRGALRVYRPY